MSDRLRIGVLISGSGTNLQSIVDACSEGRIDGEVVVVISNKDEAYGLVRAQRAGIDGVHLDPTAFETFRDYNKQILAELQARDVGLVVMAGYMRLLGKDVLEAYPNKVMNIHPALLPAFPGASGIRDAYDYGAKLSGVTIHFATAEFDEGPVISQEAVVIEEGESIESLTERVHEVEHRLYPEVIQAFAEGRLSVEGRKVRVLPPS